MYYLSFILYHCHKGICIYCQSSGRMRSVEKYLSRLGTTTQGPNKELCMPHENNQAIPAKYNNVQLKRLLKEQDQLKAFLDLNEEEKDKWIEKHVNVSSFRTLLKELILKHDKKLGPSEPSSLSYNRKYWFRRKAELQNLWDLIKGNQDILVPMGKHQGKTLYDDWEIYRACKVLLAHTPRAIVYSAFYNAFLYELANLIDKAEGRSVSAHFHVKPMGMSLLEMRVQALENSEDIINLQAENDKLRATIEEKDGRIEILNIDIAQQKQQHEIDLNTCEENFDRKLEAQKTHFEVQLTQQRTEIEDQHKKISALETKISTKENETIENLAGGSLQEAQLYTILEDMQKKMDKQDEERQVQNKNIDALNRSLQIVSNELKAVKEELAEKVQTIADLSNRVVTEVKKNDGLLKENEVLKQRIRMRSRSLVEMPQPLTLERKQQRSIRHKEFNSGITDILQDLRDDSEHEAPARLRP